MASKKESYWEGHEKDFELLGNIYRVVKSLDQKVESLLEEIHDFVEAGSEDYEKDYWEENGNGFF